MSEELKQLLLNAKRFAYLYECMAPLFVVYSHPLRTEEARKSAVRIMEDAERAAQFRIEIEEYLKRN